MKDIAIIGAGGFGREVNMLINQINVFDKKFNFIGFFDDGIQKGTKINNSMVLGNIADLNDWGNPLLIVIAIGNPKIKKVISEKITNPHVSYPVLVHPSVIIGDNFNNQIGNGSIVCAGVIITVDVKIGSHVILNLSCTVGHDTIISDYCSIMPGVNISGEIVISNCVFVGTGAKIINLLKIGENTIIGAGALVAKNLPSNCTAIGVPAKIIKLE
jgi:sugar O-acyltransferase (sialic acid O-acetyltransferase NeuD family)